MDCPLICAGRPKQFRRLHTVLIRPLFEVNVVQDADDLPEIRFVSVAQFLGEPAQNAAHRFGVVEVIFVLIILPHQSQCFFSVHMFLPPSILLLYYAFCLFSVLFLSILPSPPELPEGSFPDGLPPGQVLSPARAAGSPQRHRRSVRSPDTGAGTWPPGAAALRTER